MPFEKPQKFFSEYVSKQADGCWLWIGGVSGSGYGAYTQTHGKQESAHVFAYTRFYGPVPGGLEVGHTCGVKLCVNPEHLEAMTHKKNMRMRNIVKLTEKDIENIKYHLQQGESQSTIAKLYKLNQSTVSRIASGKRWS